jgi:hypothetical protein
MRALVKRREKSEGMTRVLGMGNFDESGIKCR